MPTASDDQTTASQPDAPQPRRTPGLRTMLAAFFAAITAVPLAVGLVLITTQVDQRFSDRAATELVAASQRVANAIAERETRAAETTADLTDLLVADGQADALADADGAVVADWLAGRADERIPERADVLVVVEPGGDLVADAGQAERATSTELAGAVARGASPDGGLLTRREVRADVDGQEQSLGWIGAFVEVDAGELAEASAVELAVLADGEPLTSSQEVPDTRPEPGEAATWEDGEQRVMATTVVTSAGDVLVWRPDPGGLALGGLLATVAAPALLLAGGLGWLLARRMTEPVGRAAQTARAVARGDLDHHVPTDEGPAEVRELAVALNRMSNELSLRLRELEASRDALGASLERVGQTLASSLDLDRVLGVIAESAADVLDADGAHVVLRDPTGQLVVRARHGSSDKTVGDVVPSGDAESAAGSTDPVTGAGGDDGAGDGGGDDAGGVDGGDGDGDGGAGVEVSVARHGQALRVSPGSGAPALATPVLPCQLAVPLTVRGETEGVLTLVRDHPDRPFDERQEALLRSFAAQASVALENVHRHAEAQEQAATDGLTGLANVRTLRAALRREVEAAERYGRPVSVLMIDLDRFKEVNDRWGHEAGDQVLSEVARRLQGVSRGADLVARAGGEEFVMLLPETPAAGAEILAERVREVVAAQPIVTSNRVVLEGITCSVGVAGRHAQEGPDDLLRRADAAQYEAKRHGRNRVVVADETTEHTTPTT